MTYQDAIDTATQEEKERSEVSIKRESLSSEAPIERKMFYLQYNTLLAHFSMFVWNMNIWNDKYGDDILTIMKNMMEQHHLICLTEVADSAPIDNFCKNYLKDHKYVKMGMREKNSGTKKPSKYCVMLYKDPLQLIQGEVKIKGIKNQFEREPATCLFKASNWKFYVTGVHLSTGIMLSFKIE